MRRRAYSNNRKYSNNNNNNNSNHRQHNKSKSPISTLIRKASFNRKKKGEDPIMSDQQQYKYMTADGDKLGADDSLKIDVTHDERRSHHERSTAVQIHDSRWRQTGSR
uniref:Uncharacterized protein n=1 Tax=Cacopsylla melanoneura TaxID=428564 RepID=A0A8D8QME6_9HEMI